jgi:(2Fe-2S) ferredoxin
MEVAPSKFKRYILVCENEREDGRECCAPEGAVIRETLKNEIKAQGLASQIRVSRTGCLDVCADGPTVLMMPDNLWFKQVGLEDLPRILEIARENL